MTPSVKLFSPLKIKTVEIKNRAWVSPMCQYSSQDGYPTDWHLVHLGSRAVGGAGFIMMEATAVSPVGRISPGDCGIWSDHHIPNFKRITDFVKTQDAVIGIQIAHAGRKASTAAPWLGGKILTGNQAWQTVAPSAIPFDKSDPLPHAMTHDDLKKALHDFETATERSLAAGFQVLEIHMAHGYLLHQFLSPLSNQRKDEYGGNFENRMRFPLEIAQAVRKKWPQDFPLFVRISATDWLNGPEELIEDAEKSFSGINKGWDLSQSILFCKKLKELGVDLIDCSSGGTLPHAEIPVGPGFQVPFSEAIRKESHILTAAVGMITDPLQAETILSEDQADAIFMAREFLRDAYWPMHAAKSLGIKIQKPKQYGRA